ncbi:MAG TPA: GDSL-type esterase/lipase family protein [Gemmatimonadaceae bacterium]|nr:GDSL-type esterase/lipase family protein [Gemmatimonadaceae bacterium]
MCARSLETELAHYLALGDSVSLDLYPALDAGETDVAVALERVPTAGRVAPLGAASLLYRNDEERWPEFAGRDLVTIHPGIRHTNLARDGATIGDVFGEQLPELEPSEEPTLVSLTIGANDLLSAYASRPGGKTFARIVAGIADAYDLLVDRIREAFPSLVLLLGTLYDPSDRTGRLPGVFDIPGPMPLKHLDALNAHIRETAAGLSDARLADVYGHFLGHGVTAPEEDRWYWRRSIVEPSAMGASEIRRVWWEALGEE